MKLLKYSILVLLFCKMSFNTIQAQIDTVFWFAAPWVTPDHDGNTQMAFRISTFNNPTNVRIQMPAMTYDTTFFVAANSLADVPISHLVNDIESGPADAILTSGIKITSDELITVVYDFISDLITITPGIPNNPETYSLKGQNGMGTEFVTPFQTLWDNRFLTVDRNGDGFITQPKQFFSIVATEDNTTVYIKPNCDVIGHPADVTYSIVLPLAGNVYTCENAVMTTSAPGSSLSGSIVFSDKPVSVTINDDSVNPAGGGGCFDLMGDQIVPTDVIGNDYIVNQGFLNPGSNESIFIIAAENFTTVTVDDGAATTQLLNQGETWQYSITELLTSVQADKPLYVVHMSGYGCELGLAILPPLNCAGSDEVSLSRNNAQQFLLNILCEAGDEGAFTITPGPGTIPAGSFNPVPGLPGWVGTQIDYPVGDIAPGNQYTITNSAGFFSLGVINGGPSTGCLYHYLSSFNRKVFTDAGNDTTMCSGEPLVGLSGTIQGGSTTGSWVVEDGTGVIANATSLSTTYAPSTNDYNQGFVTFVLSSDGNCEPVRDTMVVTFIQSPIVDAGLDDEYCKNNIGAIPINGSVFFATGSSWSGGNGGAFGNSGSLSTSYTPSPSDIAADSVVLYLTSAGSLFACQDDQDTVIIHFTPSPNVLAGPDLVLCSNETTINLNGSVTGGTTSGEWSTNGAGAFAPTNLNPVTDYLISSADTAVGSITLYLTSTNNGNCLLEMDSIQVSFLDDPMLEITSSDSICSNLNVFDLDGVISFGYSPTWSTSGFGSIVAPGSINTQYNISPVDTTAGFVDIYLESNAGICPTVQDSIRIYFIDPPQVEAGLNQDFCENQVIQLNGSVTGASNSGTWSTLGTGTFNPGPNLLVTNYVPSAIDLGNGSVNLILTTESVFGCAPESDMLTITFLTPPNANFSSSIACAGENTVFTDLSTTTSGTVTNWSWEFGDAGISIVPDPLHTYPGSGNYIATLVATGSNGCTDTISQTITVNPTPIANFNPTIACEDTPVNFIDLSFISSGSIATWLYDFGSTTSSDQYPTYTFNASGNQSVTLTVTSNLGCTDDTTMNVSVNPSPVADFSFSPNPALVQEAVNFEDESTGNQIGAWFWDFGNGQANNVQNPVQYYNDGGSFEILLVVTDINGCQDSIRKIISIALPPLLPSGFTPNGDGENDVFLIRGGPFNDVDFKVYNNWGELIFTSTDAAIGWDGTYNNEPVPMGVYSWTFAVRMTNDEVIKESGDVTLIR